MPALKSQVLGASEVMPTMSKDCCQLAAGRAGLEAEELESGRQVGLGQGITAAGGSPAFEQVVREEADGRLQGSPVNDLGRLLGVGRKEEVTFRRLFLGTDDDRRHQGEEQERPSEDLRPGSCFFECFIRAKPPGCNDLERKL